MAGAVADDPPPPALAALAALTRSAAPAARTAGKIARSRARAAPPGLSAGSTQSRAVSTKPVPGSNS